MTVRRHSYSGSVSPLRRAHPAHMPCVSSQYPLSEDSESTTTVVVTPPHEPHSQRRKVGGKDTPLTLEQLIAIGRDRGLTLYP